MDNAEKQLSNAPDSALNTMRSIRKIAIVLPERRARYGLLYSMALDKNYIDIAADSLIRFSTQYYDHKGSPEQRMRAYYYLGRTQENAGDNLAATLSFLDAAQYLDQVGDNYLKGLLCSRISGEYYKYYNYQQAYNYAQKSLEFFTEARLKRHQAFQLYEIGRIYNCQNHHNKCVSTLIDAIQLASECNFNQLIPFCKLTLLNTYTKSNQYKEAYSILQTLQPEQYTQDILTICGAAVVFHKYNKKDKAQKLIDKGWTMAKDAIDSSVMYQHCARIEYISGKYLNSYILSNKGLDIQLTLAEKQLSSPIGQTTCNYFTNKAIEMQNRANRVKRYYICSIIMLMFCCTLYIIYSRRKYIQQNREIERYIDAIDSLNKYKEDNQTILSESLIAQFELINQLCQTYYEHNGSSKQQSAVFKEVKVRINDICNNDKHFETLSTSVNNYNDDILTKLKQDFPNLTSNEYKLACYMCVGFSTQALCLFFNCNEDSIYNRKARLREKIKNKESEHKQLYAKTLLIR